MSTLRAVACLLLFLSLTPAGHAADSLPAGGGLPFANDQPSLGMRYMVRLQGADDELGEVGLFAANFAPQGWTLAEGQLLPIAQHPALFDLLGATFGGDGDVAFALPDLRGRTPIGVGAGPGLTSYSLGEQVGADQQTLAAVPVHSHSLPNGLTTGAAGKASSHSNLQPSLALTPVIALTGLYPSHNALTADGQVAEGVSPAGAEPYLSEVTWLAHDKVPSGWAIADGRLLDIVDHDALFSLLGTTYGGDGRVNFRLPDLRGRTPIGAGRGAGLSDRRQGITYGEEQESLSAPQLPAHSHDLEQGGQTDPAGGGAPQSNMQPSLTMRFGIALEGIYPSQAATGGETDDGPAAALGGSTDPYLAGMTMFASNFVPRGYAEASGQLLPISQHTALFSLLWNNYGGDAEVTFELPDLRGRAAVGVGAGPGLTPRLWAQPFGAEQSVLTEANIPSHSHTVPVAGDYNDDGQVDAADYTVWRDHLGAPAGSLPNDPHAGPIGAEQYAAWRDNYGQPSTPAAAAAPEPGALTLAALLAVAPLRRIRQRRRR
ncbi:Phage Tail Collar Domain protein [Posidoniimonas corsicana]|uniref:Phage Tail Collar Domain protein n=1 Tax=Posidoniimonas corsicana TaxID=1938618 RepID=A0A5C5VE43_9BACT|nr:tail fiber protein [Posidoniimonas corsicana]TWT36884.1 Phage Tail Collar Domain protein [Posidoniimonas corsicana]